MMPRRAFQRLMLGAGLLALAWTGSQLAAQTTDLQRDLEALRQFHEPGKKAAARLVERGDEFLPQLHAALNAADTDDNQRIQLSTVLGQIGDASSVDALISMVRKVPDQGGVRQAVLDALAQLPPSAEASSFADAVLADEDESWRVRRKALVYFGQHRMEAARRWIDVYREDEQIEMRAGALYLAARLGDAAALQPLAEMLALPAPRSLRYALMLGIAELVDAENLTRRTPEWIRSSWEYDSARRYAEFRTADAARRSEMTTEMLNSKSLFERQEAARHIGTSGGPDELVKLIRSTIPPHVREVARHQLRRSGFRVNVRTDGEVRLQPKAQP